MTPPTVRKASLRKAPSLMNSNQMSMQHSTRVLLVRGTCESNETNSFGSCQDGENSAARVLEVTMSAGEQRSINGSEGIKSSDNVDGCSIHNPDVVCHLQWKELWVDPNPKGDRNGGFAYFDQMNSNESNTNESDYAPSLSNSRRRTSIEPSIILLGQGGIEIFNPPATNSDNYSYYSLSFHLTPPNKTSDRSDLTRYAGFTAGYLSPYGGIITAGRCNDYDVPERDANGNAIGMNLLVYKNNNHDESSDYSSSSDNNEF